MFPCFGLELLSEDKVELTAALAAVVVLVEAVSPVDTHQTDHRQIDTYTDTCRALHLERIELARFSPGVTALHEGQSVDGRIASDMRS